MKYAQVSAERMTECVRSIGWNHGKSHEISLRNEAQSFHTDWLNEANGQAPFPSYDVTVLAREGLSQSSPLSNSYPIRL